MKELALGNKAPAFNLPSTRDKKVRLSDMIGKPVILYFYPRDNTPGCSQESADFASAHKRINRAGAVVFGISTDAMASHEKFRDKLDLPFDLLSDESGKTCEKYGVMKLKKLYGKEFLGIERSTFLIDEKGKIRAIWRKVKVAGHVEEVISELKSL